MELDAQTFDGEAEVTEQLETEATLGTTEQPDNAQADSSTDSGENHDKQHDGVQKRINQLTAEKYQEKRAREELERKLAELESQAAKPEVKIDIPAPQLPDDIYDEDAMRKYHADMIEYTSKVTEANANSAYEQRLKTEEEKQRQVKKQELLSSYANNALKDGVDLDKLRAAEQSLVSAGISSELGTFLIKDPNGGKIAEYLHDNPALMHEVLSLDPVSAGIKIVNEVKPQALSMTPKISKAPEPVTEVVGSAGGGDKDDFERQNPNTEFI